jgi:hypothetical protein
MKRIFKLAVAAYEAARHERLRARLAQHLDERTLRDIGMDLEANRVRERTRLAMRFGMY